MDIRLVNLGVIAGLVLAAVYVYDIKYESTLSAERVAKLRQDIRGERDAIAALRAEWAQLSNPRRIQSLAQRHLTLKPIEPTQFDSLDRLPERPTPAVPPAGDDPISALIDQGIVPGLTTGSIAPASERGNAAPAAGNRDVR